MNIHPSKLILFVGLMLSLILSACGSAAPQATPTAVSTNTPVPNTPTSTVTLIPTATLPPTRTPAPTATPNLAATQQYEGLLAAVEKFAAEGVIPSTSGKYYPLDDHSDSFAKIRYYTWVLYQDAEPANFIMQARVKMTNATTENVYKSGCGFVLANEFSNHGVFFSLDGNANYWADGYARGSNYLDATLYEQNPDGLTLTLLLSNKALLFYVNGRKALSGITIYGEPFNVGPAILSGTSEGFGTRCDFTEMALWQME